LSSSANAGVARRPKSSSTGIRSALRIAPGVTQATCQWHTLCFSPEQRRYVSDMSIIGWIVLGLIAGWLAGQFMRGGGYGIVGDIVLGILGALVGGWITSALLGRDMVNGFNIESLIVAVLGAIVLIAISRLFTGRRVGNRV
jgi:uncharacterized membrane protein YeaQ/YmgE (transglycosylase-associated protein family)